MPKRANPRKSTGGSPEWTEDDFARVKRFDELPEEHQRILDGIMAEDAAHRKIAVPLSREIVEEMQATGDGWELRVEEAVRQWLGRKRRTAAS